MAHRSGSKYPSAYGHTPSYRSYNSIDASVPTFHSSSSLGLGNYIFVCGYGSKDLVIASVVLLLLDTLLIYF